MSHENSVELPPVGQRAGYPRVSTVAEASDPQMVTLV
jgi:hypothetical protein